MNRKQERLDQYLKEIRSDSLEKIIREAGNVITNEISKNLENRKMILIYGNGGSSADAEHWVGELMCTYRRRDRKPIQAIALTSNPCIITAWSNDVNYETAISRQIEGYKDITGLTIALSTSGKSKNVVEALKTSKDLGITNILITGNMANINENADIHIKLPSIDTAVVQTMTQILYHHVCDLLD